MKSYSVQSQLVLKKQDISFHEEAKDDVSYQPLETENLQTERPEENNTPEKKTLVPKLNLDASFIELEPE